MKKDEFCSAIAKPISMNCIKRKIEARKVRWYRKMMNYVFKIMSFVFKIHEFNTINRSGVWSTSPACWVSEARP